MNHLFVRKTLYSITDEKQNSKLKKTLGLWSIIAFGVGAIVGAGLFARTAAAAAGGAGAGVIFSFILAGIACGFTGLCYAELATMVPVSGSAYTYSYISMGRIVAWVIGWALIQEYAFGASTVAIVASEYLNKLTGEIIPYEWIHSPLQQLILDTQGNYSSINIWKDLPEGGHILKHGILNIPSIIILTFITLLLIKGTKESALFNMIMVIVKIAIILVFVITGYHFIDPNNHIHFYIPKSEDKGNNFFHYGWGGIIFGAGTVFFAFIGFDTVSTTAQEAKNPKRDMSRGILGSLLICVILYILFGHVLTGIVNYKEFANSGQEAPILYAIEKMNGFTWLKTYMGIAILASFVTVMLAMLYGQSRILLSMANDGLMPRTFSILHNKFKTPYISNLLVLGFTGIIAGFLPADIVGDVTSFGTLFAFIAVCISVIIMRKLYPNTERAFRTPLVPLIPILGILFCLVLIIALDHFTQILSLSWLVIAVLIYMIRIAYIKVRNKKN